MNNFSDTQSDGAPDGTVDPVEAELRTYFRSRPIETLDTEAFWQRLAVRLHRPSTQPGSDAAQPRPALSSITERSTAPAGAEPRSARLPSAHRAHPIITNILAVAAVVALSVTAFTLFHGIGPFGPSDGATIQHGELVWHRVTLPPGVILQEGSGVSISVNGGTPFVPGQTTVTTPNATYAVAPSNGEVAYICQLEADGLPLIWRTVDAGQNWSTLVTLPTSEAAQDCSIQTDANDAHTVVIALATAQAGAMTYSRAFALFDGATQWQPMAAQGMRQFASTGDTYYAMRTVTPASAVLPETHLYVSTDRMRSWRQVDAPLVAQDGALARRYVQNGAVAIEGDWVQPTTGELLVQTVDGILWQSTDHGLSWRSISLPPLPPTSELTPVAGENLWGGGDNLDGLVYVQQPVVDRPFTLCALVFDHEPIYFNVAPLYCSTDSGQTWTRRARTAVTQNNGAKSDFEVPKVMLPDGELLAWDVRAIYVFPGNDSTASSARLLGTIPDPHNPDDIPGGILGVMAQGVVLWQPLDGQTLYVAQYSVGSAK